MTHSKAISVTMTILSVFIAIFLMAPHIVLAHCDQKHPQHCDSICPCFDREFLGSTSCLENDNGDRPDRPELATIVLASPKAAVELRVSIPRLGWICTYTHQNSETTMPVTEEERIACAELLLALIEEKQLMCPQTIN